MRFFVFFCMIAATIAEPIVYSELGSFTGFVQNSELGNIESFLGIPYAKPPIRDLRFELPRPYGKVGNFSADEDRLPCTQEIGTPFSKEDCLYLNVFRREGTKPNDGKAVVVFIHGGFFTYGNSLEADLKPLVGIADVIVVSFNYRLGLFGFANFGDLTPGNVGFFDQRLALEWVKDNIKDFGGDPDRVTLAGLDAGSVSIHAHLVTPLNQKRKLFNAALMDGGFLGQGLRYAPHRSFSRLREIALHFDCATEGRAMLECMRNLSTTELIEAQREFEQKSKVPAFQPTIDGVFLTKHVDEIDASEFADVKLIVGVAKDAGSMIVKREMRHFDPPNTAEEFIKLSKSVAEILSLPMNFSNPDVSNRLISLYQKQYFTLFEAVTRFITDSCFICPANNFVESYARHNRSVYMYFYERPFQPNPSTSPIETVNTFHGLAFIDFLGLSLQESPPGPEYKQFIRDAVDVFSEFVKTDHTLKFRKVQWPNFTLTKNVLRIDEIPTIAKGLSRMQSCGALFSD